MMKQGPVDDSADLAACNWLSTGGALALIAKSTSQTVPKSIDLLMSHLRTGGIVIWSMACLETKTILDTGKSSVFQSCAPCYLTDQIQTEAWREYTDPENGEVDLNWQTGGLQFSGEYRAYPFAGKSNRTDLYSDVATKMELVGLHFRRTDIEDICARSTFIAVPQLKKGKGRPAGAGSMDKADAPLLLEMRELIEKGNAFSPNGAAMLVAGKAAGNGTQESKIARLGRRYGALEKN